MNPPTFPGFATSGHATAVPSLFFAEVLPQISDSAELKVTLHLLWVLPQIKTYPRLITYRQLLADRTLVSSLAILGGSLGESLERGLRLACHRGTLLHLRLEKGGAVEELYFLHTETDKHACEAIERGDIDLGAALLALDAAEPRPARSIFDLYEQNVGLLTPLISEELAQAEQEYPPEWIEAAFRQAVTLNRRNWRYIARILQRWEIEGPDDAEPGRHPEKPRTARDYLRGPYGHVYQR